MTRLEAQPPRRVEPRMTPADHAAEMRARAEDATDETARAYWLWLAAEWDKTAFRHRFLPPRSWSDE
ncbi:MAG TPA: hypothetical protein VKQ70_10420 [Caulobacteraceae bacterium]|nr:hypothetical protein [Caulobacteraceae bacterium]